MLGTLNQPDRLRCPVRSGDPGGRGPRGAWARLGLAYVVAGVAMIPWLFYLAFTLPASATDGHWALAWVGLDSCEALALFAPAGCCYARTTAVSWPPPPARCCC